MVFYLIDNVLCALCSFFLVVAIWVVWELIANRDEKEHRTSAAQPYVDIVGL